MKHKHIPTTLPESWFIERVGEYIMAKSDFFNGPMRITDEDHAKYLCHTSQKYFFYRFSDLLSKEQNVQASVATDDDSSTKADKQIKQNPFGG